MNEFTWHNVYYSELQSLYALLVVPIAFLAFRLAAPSDGDRAEVPAAARFVSGLTLFFAFETMIDPISTGPLLKLEILRESRAAMVIPFIFVLLGDVRVLLLAIGVARPEHTLRRNLRWAFGMSLIVPIAAGAIYAIAGWLWPDIQSKVLWMLYEFGFFALCVFLARVWVPGNVTHDPDTVAFLRSIFGYSAAYYLLWFLADVLIVVGEMDIGWAIRIVPNQLYYALWAPFVYWRFFSSRRDHPPKAPLT
jgi:hypothetical protein